MDNFKTLIFRSPSNSPASLHPIAPRETTAFSHQCSRSSISTWIRFCLVSTLFCSNASPGLPPWHSNIMSPPGQRTAVRPLLCRHSRVLVCPLWPCHVSISLSNPSTPPLPSCQSISLMSSRQPGFQAVQEGIA